jgi:hypothetical protein
MYSYNKQAAEANRTKAKLNKLGVDINGVTSFIMEEV